MKMGGPSSPFTSKHLWLTGRIDGEEVFMSSWTDLKFLTKLSFSAWISVQWKKGKEGKVEGDQVGSGWSASESLQSSQASKPSSLHVYLFRLTFRKTKVLSLQKICMGWGERRVEVPNRGGRFYLVRFQFVCGWLDYGSRIVNAIHDTRDFASHDDFDYTVVAVRGKEKIYSKFRLVSCARPIDPLMPLARRFLSSRFQIPSNFKPKESPLLKVGIRTSLISHSFIPLPSYFFNCTRKFGWTRSYSTAPLHSTKVLSKVSRDRIYFIAFWYGTPFFNMMI